MVTSVSVKLHSLPTHVFVVLPNSGHETNERALAEFVYHLGVFLVIKKPNNFVSPT